MLILAVAIRAAIGLIDGSVPRLHIPARLALFVLAALMAGAIVLAVEFDDALLRQWI